MPFRRVLTLASETVQNGLELRCLEPTMPHSLKLLAFAYEESTHSAVTLIVKSVPARSVVPANDVADQGLVDRLRNAAPGDSFQGESLIGVKLRGVLLRQVDFRDADLSCSDLQGATFVNCDFRHARLHRAELGGAEFLGTDLRHANLSEAKAAGAGFGRAQLDHANCFAIDLTGATLTGASLYSVDFRTALLVRARLRDTDLERANFQRAQLQHANLDCAHVRHCNFVEADLREARLRNLRSFATASFHHADIRDIDFSGAYLLRRQILDENYLIEFRAQGLFSTILYWLWWVTSDCGRSIGRWAGWTALVWLGFGTAYRSCELDFGGHPSPIAEYYFSLVTLTTLGYGDVLPASMAAQLVVMAEVVMGYLMLGGLLSIISSKMGRRAD